MNAWHLQFLMPGNNKKKSNKFNTNNNNGMDISLKKIHATFNSLITKTTHNRNNNKIA